MIPCEYLSAELDGGIECLLIFSSVFSEREVEPGVRRGKEYMELAGLSNVRCVFSRGVRYREGRFGCGLWVGMQRINWITITIVWVRILSLS